MIERAGFEALIVTAACGFGLLAFVISLVGTVKGKLRERRIAYLEGRVATLRQRCVRLANELSDTRKAQAKTVVRRLNGTA